jgi:hypothetical protein
LIAAQAVATAAPDGHKIDRDVVVGVPLPSKIRLIGIVTCSRTQELSSPRLLKTAYVNFNAALTATAVNTAETKAVGRRDMVDSLSIWRWAGSRPNSCA